jgi:hypothetical protein
LIVSLPRQSDHRSSRDALRLDLCPSAPSIARMKLLKSLWTWARPLVMEALRQAAQIFLRAVLSEVSVKNPA